MDAHHSGSPAFVLRDNEFAWRTRPRTEAIIVHCAPAPEGQHGLTYFRHRGRQMGLLDVGYHYVVEVDGSVGGARPHNSMGSHLTLWNHKTIGICLVGMGDSVDDQLWSLATLINWLHTIYGNLPVYGRYEVDRREVAPYPGPDMEAFRRNYLGMTLDADNKAPREVPLVGKLSTQNSYLLDYLRAGNRVTNLVALTNLHLGSLSSRISELRRAGWNIGAEHKKDYHGKRYWSYFMEHPERVAGAEAS